MGFGYAWAPICQEDGCKKLGDHSTGSGINYCKKHYRIKAQGWSECMGCLGTGKAHSNMKPCFDGSTCYLCKGEGILSP